MSVITGLAAWVFANPVLVTICLFGILLLLFVQWIRAKLTPGPNPFAEDCVRPPVPVVTDTSARDKVLKQG